MWRLIRLEAEGFRGINKRITLDPHPQLTIIFGENGSGKTSLAEAIEWVIRDTTQKLEDARISNRVTEISGSLRNLHAGERPTRVALTFESDGLTVVFERQLQQGSHASALSSQGDSSLLPTLPWNSAPIVLQHGLRSFIDAPPAKRWDRIATMLDLEPLEKFKDFVGRAVTIARHRFSTLVNALDRLAGEASSRGLNDLAAAIRKRSLAHIDQAVSDLVAHALGEVVPQDRWFERLTVNLHDIRRRSFPALFSDEQTSLIEPLPEDYWMNLLGLIDAFDRQIDAKRAYLASSDDAARIGFLKAGLEFVREGDPTCPFCSQRTLTEERLAQIRELVKNEHDEAPRTATLIREALNNGLGRLCASLPPRLPEEETARLRLNVPPEVWSRYENVVRMMESVQESLRTTTERIGSLLTKVMGSEGSPDSLQRSLTHLRDAVSNAHEMADNAIEVVGEYSDVIRKLRQHAGAVLAGEEAALVENALWAVEQLPLIERALRAERLVSLLRADEQRTAGFLREAVQERIEDRKTDIITWYQLLNPGEPVGLVDVRVRGRATRRSVDLIAHTFGVEAHAAGILSESHLNAVGLAVYLSQHAGPSNPTRLIIFDDPVQSMDEDHTIRFCTEVLGRLIDNDYQVVILTHLASLANRIFDLYYHLAPDYFIASTASEEGLELKPYKQLGQLLSHARRAASAAHPDLRTGAAANVRAFIDRFCTMVYTQATGQPMPIARRGWTATKDRLKLVEERCPNVQPKHLQTLRDVCNSADPGAHIDETGAALSSAQWIQLIQRCESVGRYYFPKEFPRAQALRESGSH